MRVSQSFTQNDQYHREDGPAVIYTDGTREWYLNGKLHREDGPAVECPDGSKYWYLNGRRINPHKEANVISVDFKQKKKIR
jgi:hypothetical protein